jgi:beta-lactamase class A
MCSVFKTIAVAAVLRDLDEDVLAEVVHYDERDVERSGGAPVTGKPENLAAGMTVAELCGARSRTATTPRQTCCWSNWAGRWR